MQKVAPVVALLALTVTGCVPADQEGEATGQAQQSQQAEAQEAELTCQEVSTSTESYFQEVGTDKQPDARLSHGHIVHSPRSYQGREIYFLSFAVNGGEHIVTWAQTGPDPTAAMQVAVRASYADELSILGTAGSPDVARDTWPGAKESQECVRAALEG